MLVDEHPHAPAHLAGEHQKRQDEHRDEQKGDLQQRAEITAHLAQIQAGGGHHQQVDAAADEGEGIKDDLAGDEDVQLPVGIARRRHGDQRGHDGGGGTARDEQILVHRTEQRRGRVQQHVVDEHAADGQTHHAHRPAVGRHRVAIEILDHRQTDHGQQQPTAEIDLEEAGIAGLGDDPSQAQAHVDRQQTDRHDTAGRQNADQAGRQPPALPPLHRQQA